jgi:signal transduction histidine kinase
VRPPRSGTRLLLLKSALVTVIGVALIWELGDVFYASDREYWEAGAQGVCDTLDGVRPSADALLSMPPAAPDTPDEWAVDCGAGLRVRSGAHEFEVVGAGPDGQLHQVAAFTPPWPDEPYADLGYRLSAFGISLFLGLFVAVPLVRRAREIERVAVRIAGGELDARAAAEGPGELASLAQAIHSMADRLSGQLRARRVMLRAVAHEMGQPLTRMRFSLALLDEAENDASRDKQLERLTEDVDRIEALSAAVGQQLRDDAQPHAAPVQPVSLQPILAHLLAELDPRGRTLTVDADDVEAAVDPALFRIAARNLLDNAVRHARSKVSIRLDADALVVEDDGPGVPDPARALRPFEQGEGGGRLGLGLPIAADVARVFGGPLEIGVGALGGARIVLPLRPPTAPGG